MTGPTESVIGRTVESVLSKFRTGMPAKFNVATEGVVLQGAILEVRTETGMAVSIVRVQEKVP
jgi:hypothetical protein